MELIQNSQKVVRGVHLLSPLQASFESAYLELREAEGRLHPDEEVRRLPNPSHSNPQRQEWRLRQQSFRRLKQHLQSHPPPGPVLDLGCGNGWLSHYLNRWTRQPVLGVDINQAELEQAARLFAAPECQFAYADIFRSDLPEGKFSLVILNSVIQYFKSLETLLHRLQTLLQSGGAIHILDSPLYDSEELAAAKTRSLRHFQQMGQEEMGQYYHHHSWSELDVFPYEILYHHQPGWTAKIMARMGWRQNPFAWLRIPGQM